jgi:bisphosphoglycerate-independent phosphoglycerate mutase (AlkP superfamily)
VLRDLTCTNQIQQIAYSTVNCSSADIPTQKNSSKHYVCDDDGYEKDFDYCCIFSEFVAMPFGRVLSERGLRQPRMCETEKERFVTYYLMANEKMHFRWKIESLFHHKRFRHDQMPEMSALDHKTLLEKTR